MATNLTNFYERGTDVADIYIGKDEVEAGILNRSINTDILSDIGFDELTQYTLWGWGEDSGKRLGINYSNTSSPVIVTNENITWRYVSVSGSHVGATKCDGTLWMWGCNQLGELGDNTVIDRYTPTQEITASTNWNKVEVGDVHTTAIKSDGTIWSWGFNEQGQLGINSFSTSCRSPVQEITGSTWNQVSTHSAHTMAIKSDGTLWGWGWNPFGQIGNGSTSMSVRSPVQEILADTIWCAISTGHSHSLAIKQNGTLWASGWNLCGELGNNTTTASTSFVQESSISTDWNKVSAGYFSSAAIKTNCSLFTWGDNVCGQMGDGTIVTKCTPTQEVTQSQNWSSISAGKNRHMAAIKTDGTLWSWGRNTSGEIGNGTTTDVSSPVQEIRGIDTWSIISAGKCSAIGLKK